jgi:HlyD family secretion protein
MRRERATSIVILLVVLIAACGRPFDPRVVVGTLERDRIELVAEVSELIRALHVREGDHVSAGEAVAQFDTAILDAQIAQSTAALARAEARLAELKRGPRQERIAEARARLRGAESAVTEAERELARLQELVAENAAPRVDRDRWETQRSSAIARRDEARAGLAALANGTTAEEIAQAEAAVREAVESLAALKVRADRLVARAPRGGTVDALPFEVGERPPAGATVAVLLADGPPYARVFIPETIRVRVREGTAARVKIDGIAEPLAARVRSVAHRAAFTPYNALTERDRGHLSYLAEVELTGQTAALPTGLPVEVTLDIAAPE